jgi:F-box/leucine-rich repeat protein 2/20
VTAATL